MDTSEKEKIDNLREFVTSLPQLTNMVTTHHFAGGMYLRKVWRAAGTLVCGREHLTEHFFMCMSGQIIVYMAGNNVTLYPGDIISCPIGSIKITYSPVDSIGANVFKTNKTDLAELEAELLVDEPGCMYDFDNKVKDLQLNEQKLKELIL